MSHLTEEIATQYSINQSYRKIRKSKSNNNLGELSGVGGVEPPSSCLQTPIFEWKSAINFNPWAKFQTFRQVTPPVLLRQFQHCLGPETGWNWKRCQNQLLFPFPHDLPENLTKFTHSKCLQIKLILKVVSRSPQTSLPVTANKSNWDLQNFYVIGITQYR